MSTPQPSHASVIAEIPILLRAQWVKERQAVTGYGDTYNDADGCWGLHTTPGDILADIQAKETLLQDLLAERHTVCHDGYYTCCAATRERDGDTCQCCEDDADATRGCTCGLQKRTARRLRILASPYAGSPDYKETWSLKAA